MLSSITPLGERGRGRNWSLTATAFTVGAVVSGWAVFALVGWLGQAVGLPGQLWTWGLALLAAAVAADLLGVTPPGPRRQVDEDWLNRYRGWVVGLGYGLQLGSGFATIVPAWASWGLLLISAFSGPEAGALIGVAFGLGRSVLLLAGGRINDHTGLRRRLLSFTLWQRRVAVGTALVQAGVVAVLWRSI
jgi:hypothetical protein